jgi:LmbE family N-acetylglucosaminyl deacetylase
MKNLVWVILLLPILATAQSYQQQPPASQIKLRLKRLNFLGSVLYVAAHPDDENTRVITTFANDRLAATAYLSLTRGDGGQNLIGAEIGELLGVIRTQELLAARRIDGGKQFFTRAVDFGFSKSADEALSIWEKNDILSDVVKVFRQYQPDVIITRFPPDERAGHGHHTASAILAGEAFDAAANPNVYPDQVKQFGTWQVRRFYTNTGRWWNASINETTPGILSMDVGGYNPLLGKSYTEISALSSSQHKSQGWGRRGERGQIMEFFEYMKGSKAEKDFFEGIDTSWKRLKGGEKIQSMIEQAIREFNGENPAAIVSQLTRIKKEIQALDNSVWKTRKLEETEQLIQDCLGLFVEATAQNFQGTPGEHVRISLEVVSRSAVNLKLLNIQSATLKWDTLYAASIPNFKNTTITSNKPTINPSASYSGPYWLSEAHNPGIYKVTNEKYIGLPENLPAVDITFNFEIDGEKYSVSRPLIYKWVDPVKGELWRPFEIVPPVFVNPLEHVALFTDTQPKAVSILLKSTLDRPVDGTLILQLPKGWRSEPVSIPFKMTKRDEEEIQTFQIYPTEKESTGVLKVVAQIEGKTHDRALQLISYDHIPTQTLMRSTDVTVSRLDVRKEATLVGYINGAGDEIPSALKNMGCEVWEMKDEEVTPSNLKKLDAVVLGVRALNTNKRIRFYIDDLLNYVKDGGTVVMQYNINFDFGKEKLSPYPFKLSRDRVTEENAEVRILKPDHPVLNTPNKITPKDFEGWVQERGLYFASEWDPAFEAILSMNDRKETPKDGSLLVAQYGKGYFVYTGISFFRQLPAGVSGAYKLFANLISLGKGKSVSTLNKQGNQKSQR